jgi:cyanophycinase
VSFVIGLWGSGEFEDWSEQPERWLLERARAGGSVLVLPTASAPDGDEVFDRWARMGVAHYEAMGVEAKVLAVKTREDADLPEHVKELEGASMVYFSGGNPAYLARTLQASALWLSLLEQMEQGLAYAGCSAGIAALGEITGDPTAFDPDARWQRGLCLFPDLSFGPHWDALDVFVPGLKQTIVERVPRGARLLAIDEHTAVVGDGIEWRVMGSSSAHLLQNGEWTDHPSGSTFELAVMEGNEL